MVSLEDAVRRLVESYAPSKDDLSLRRLCRQFTSALATMFGEFDEVVEEEILSHRFVDPAQTEIPL